MSPAVARRIAQLDARYTAARPRSFELDVGGQKVAGRFVYAHGAGELYREFDGARERLATVSEVVRLRLAAFDQLLAGLPAAEAYLSELERGGEPAALEGGVRLALVDRIHPLWRIRLTTSTHMVRAPDERGADTIFFFTGNAYGDPVEMRRALEGELSDGGLHYDEHAIARVVRGTPAGSRLSYATYLASRGGNFSGGDFARHPIFLTSVGDAQLFERYVYALSVLNLTDFYNAGIHSGWRPGEMKPFHGRPVALGYKGEAFYPPNNSTVDHAAAIVPIDFELSPGALD